MCLIGNKTDLFHMQAVKLDKHNTFADRNGLYSYLVSAKTGDQVYNSFFRVAADLSGVVLSAADIESAQKVIKAEIVTYANSEEQQQPKIVTVNTAPPPTAPATPHVTLPPAPAQREKKKKKCTIF
mmetsp:Transcript_23650/g.23402  ORF Transcript_23650/g.23402 Transcript_23650/m.23402 type:complete len:126 (-) Transcript_23650:39-416(-)